MGNDRKYVAKFCCYHVLLTRPLVWTQKFGFHNVWEFWLYQVYYGFFVCPWYAYSFTMVSEVTPRGKEFLFFSL